MGNNRSRKAVETTSVEPVVPIAQTVAVMPSFSTEVGGSLATTSGNGAIAPQKDDQREKDDQRGTGRVEESKLSAMTDELLQRASQLAGTINATASGRLAAAEEFILELVNGESTIESLVMRYGLTDDVSAQRELVKLKQLSNSIELSIAQKGVQILALKDQRKTLEISEQEAKLAGQVWETTDAIDSTRHKSVMTPLQMHIRAHQERGKKAQEQIEKHSADKKEVKRDGILKTMQATAQRMTGQGQTAQTQSQGDSAHRASAPVQPTQR